MILYPKKTARKKIMLTFVLAAALLCGKSGVWAQEETTLLSETETVAETATETTPPVPRETGNQRIETDPVAENNREWARDALTTVGLRFTIRGKEALAWTLGVTESGFDNPAIQNGYRTVLTIVNSLFILGLLGIAGLWMFSLVVPRDRLRRVMLVYAIAVILVNFALPLNRLLVDGTALLQKTLLTENGAAIGIVNIVETPPYGDAIGFHKKNRLYKDPGDEESISIEINDAKKQDVGIGKIMTDPLTPRTLDGALSMGADGGRILLTEQPGSASDIRLKTEEPVQLSISREAVFDPDQESRIFAFILMMATGLAYLSMALIFLLRIVILWGLLIVSPVLFLLAVFSATRGYFLNWLSLYGRWLLIGPLVALGISITVGIWRSVGIPVTSGYIMDATADNLGAFSNLRFYLPGKTVANTLSTTGEMMEYILFLIMLYLPLFFGFALTRQKTWQSAVSVAARGFSKNKGGTKTEVKTEKTGGDKSPEEKPGGLLGGLKDFVNTQISRAAGTAMPERLTAPRQNHPAPGAASFLPEQLALNSLPGMMELLGADKKSRHSREQVIEKLADPSRVADAFERRNVEAVRNEIETRAADGAPEAVLMMAEIESKMTEKEPAGTAWQSAAPTAVAPTAVTAMPSPKGATIETPRAEKTKKDQPDENEDTQEKESEKENEETETAAETETQTDNNSSLTDEKNNQ